MVTETCNAFVWCLHVVPFVLYSELLSVIGFVRFEWLGISVAHVPLSTYLRDSVYSAHDFSHAIYFGVVSFVNESIQRQKRYFKKRKRDRERIQIWLDWKDLNFTDYLHRNFDKTQNIWRLSIFFQVEYRRLKIPD